MPPPLCVQAWRGLLAEAADHAEAAALRGALRAWRSEVEGRVQVMMEAEALASTIQVIQRVMHTFRVIQLAMQVFGYYNGAP